MNKNRRPDGIFFNEKKGMNCIKHGYGTSIYWNARMLADIRRYFPVMKNEDAADMLGVSVRTMIRKARELGIEKSEEFIKKIKQENLALMHTYNRCIRNSGMFRKGERASIATEFKPKNKQQ